MASVWGELKRRNVVRVAAVYALVALVPFVLAQEAEQSRQVERETMYQRYMEFASYT